MVAAKGHVPVLMVEVESCCMSVSYRVDERRHVDLSSNLVSALIFTFFIDIACECKSRLRLRSDCIDLTQHWSSHCADGLMLASMDWVVIPVQLVVTALWVLAVSVSPRLLSWHPWALTSVLIEPVLSCKHMLAVLADKSLSYMFRKLAKVLCWHVDLLFVCSRL